MKHRRPLYRPGQVFKDLSANVKYIVLGYTNGDILCFFSAEAGEFHQQYHWVSKHDDYYLKRYTELIHDV